SSRRRHTRWPRDWSSDVCSSDLCAAEASDGFFAAVAPGDEFGEERIVVVGNSPAFIDAVVETNAGAAGNLARQDFSRRWEEIVEIGRASCRERGEIAGGAGALNR